MFVGRTCSLFCHVDLREMAERGLRKGSEVRQGWNIALLRKPLVTYVAANALTMLRCVWLYDGKKRKHETFFGMLRLILVS